MRVLIAPDKFKGTLSARDAAGAIARGWCRARPADSLDLLPMSDGGDGFGEIFAALLRARRRRVSTLDAAHRPLRCPWWWRAESRTAIIESAKAIGLATLPRATFHPFQLDTFGLGKILQAAVKAGAKHCIIGVGGSATNDAGFGLARALGWQFFGHSGELLEEWWQLSALSDIHPPVAPLKLRVTVAADVCNPLLGPSGCSSVYGAQKGLRPDDLELTEKCLTRLAAFLRERHGIQGAKAPGAGAAGGLAFGLASFAGARIEAGFDLFAHAARLEKRIRAAGLVVTGEGTMDEQTRMGKGVGQIARLCANLAVPCLGLAGVVENAVKKKLIFTQVRALTDIATLPQSHRHPARVLEQLSEQISLGWSASR